MSDSNFAAPQQPVQPVQPQPQQPQPTQGNGLRNLLVSLNKTIFSIGADHPINITAIIGAVASLLCLISCFLPFANVTAKVSSYFGYSDSTSTGNMSLANSSTSGGMTTWGTILIVFSIVAILSFSMRNVATAVTIIVAGAVMLIDAFLANNNIHKQIDKSLGDQDLGMYSSMLDMDIDISLKIAFWLIIIASIVVILAGVAMLLQVQWGIATQTFKFGGAAPQGQAQGQGFQSATSTMFAGAAQPQQPAPAQPVQYAQPQAPAQPVQYAQPQAPTQPVQAPVQPAQPVQQTPVDPTQQQNLQ